MVKTKKKKRLKEKFNTNKHANKQPTNHDSRNAEEMKCLPRRKHQTYQPENI